MKKQYTAMIIILTMLLCSCGSEKIYDTDVIGKFSKLVNSGTYKSETYYNFEENNDFQYYSYDSINNKEGSSSNGTYTITDINEDIIKIDTSVDDYNYIFKYKNMIGSYFECKVPDKKKFNLTIENTNLFPSDDENLDYDDIIFHDDGTLYCSANKDNLDDAGIVYNYKRKNNEIYVSSDSNNQELLFYIVDGGLFSPELYKKK